MRSLMRWNIEFSFANVYSPLGLLLLLLGGTLICGWWNDVRYFSWSLVFVSVIVAGLIWPWIVSRCITLDAVIPIQRVHALESVAIDIHIQNHYVLAVWGLKLLPHSALPEGMAIPPVWPWQKQTFTVTVHPTTRGWFPAEPFQVTTRFPFDLWGKRFTVPITPILVWPQSADMTQVKLHRASANADADLVHRPSPCGAILGMRNYRPGDHYRQISWRHVAKLERLVVRESEEPFGICHRLLIDTSNVDGFEKSLQVVAGLIEYLQNEPMSLCCGGRYIPPGCGVMHMHKMLDMLAMVPVNHADRVRHNHQHSLWIGPECESPATSFVRTPLEGIVIAPMGASHGRLAESA